ncbi:hypothetical protein C8Q80DRAFT_854309 [Daedaleopsis nitida]|nr:hypothetical protein C8Q80DRAFT_854309 [Daedaleopsis nitida]
MRVYRHDVGRLMNSISLTWYHPLIRKLPEYTTKGRHLDTAQYCRRRRLVCSVYLCTYTTAVSPIGSPTPISDNLRRSVRYASHPELRHARSGHASVCMFVAATCRVRVLRSCIASSTLGSEAVSTMRSSSDLFLSYSTGQWLVDPCAVPRPPAEGSDASTRIHSDTTMRAPVACQEKMCLSRSQHTSWRGYEPLNSSMGSV